VLWVPLPSSLPVRKKNLKKIWTKKEEEKRARRAVGAFASVIAC
jgi:hypothetical protein